MSLISLFGVTLESLQPLPAIHYLQPISCVISFAHDIVYVRSLFCNRTDFDILFFGHTNGIIDTLSDLE